MTDQHAETRTPDADYSPYESFKLEPNHPSEVNFASLKLTLQKSAMGHVHAINREDALRLAISILDTLADELQGPEEEETTAAVTRVEKYLRTYWEMQGLDPVQIHGLGRGGEMIPLLTADLTTLIRAARS